MSSRGHISITVKKGWENVITWSSTPGFISYRLGVNTEHIFSCYITRGEKTVQLSNIEPTELIASQKSLVDAYIYVALKGVISLAGNIGAKRLVLDSSIPAIANHMLDMGFNVTPRGTSGSRGCKLLED